MSPPDEAALVVCPACSAEYEPGSYCGECGYGQEVGEIVEEVESEPVYARAVEARPFPVHEPAWCPYCVAWLRTFPSKEEARSYERSLADHPIEYCHKRLAGLNGSEEWRTRHEAGRRGSIAITKPGSPRVLPTGVSA